MDGKQLKNSILQWAIQGKLVPQNPKDEPAQKLLERIAVSRNAGDSRHSERSEESSKGSKKTSLRGAKATKQSKALSSRIYRENGVWYEQVGTATPKDISDEIPFEIPENWAWCRMAQLAEIQSSKRVFEKDYVSAGIPFFRSKEIGDLSRGESIHTELYITRQHYKELKEKYGVPQVGDILLTSVGSIGNLWICDGREFYYKDGNVTQICCNSSFDSQYVALYLSSPLFFEQIRSSVAGTAYNALTIIKLKSLILPLPPLAEQKRIVAKLEQVLPLAEEYGAAQEQLDKLNKELPETLKKSILQEAIQGKLVPQNPKDEPAQKLLEKIALSRHSERSEESSKRSKKASLRGAKATKQSKNPPSRIYHENGVWYEQIGTATPKDITDEIPFEIPETWAWCRLKDVVYNHGQKTPTESFSYIDIGSIDNKHQKLNDKENIIQASDAPSRARKIVKINDILYSTVRPYLHNMCVIDREFSKEPIASTGFAVMACYECIDVKFLFYYLLSPEFDDYANDGDNAKGIAYPAINDEKLYKALIPVPPLAEQKRIVAKLEQLFKVL